MTEINKICRVCLGNVKKRDKSIGEKFMNIPIFHHIMSVAKVKIRANADFPVKICQLCFEQLKTSIYFKRTCEKNNRVYQETFAVYTKIHFTRPHHSEAEIKKECDSEHEDEILYDPELLADDLENEVSQYRANENYNVLETSFFGSDGASIQMQNTQTQNRLDTSLLMHAYSDDDMNDQYDYGEDDKNEKISGIANEANFEVNHIVKAQPQCDDCKEYFKSKMKLQVHWKIVHLPTLLTCGSCQRTFKTFKALRSHRQKQPKTCVAAANFVIHGTGKNKTHVCKLCGIKCDHSQIVYHYFTEHTDKQLHSLLQNKDNKGLLPPKKKDENSYRIDLKLQCDDCKEFYRTKAKLSVHWKRVHMPQRLTCQICKKRFSNFKTFNSHQKQKPQSCTEAVNFHIEYVGKKRLFHCKLCSYKKFRLKYMILHNRVHTGERPHVCTKCGSSYKERLSLSVHMECAHQEYKIITSCEYCGIILKGRHKMRQHMEKHKIQPRLQCHLCAKTFKNRKSLRGHTLLHTGEKKYKCENCPRTFYARNTYNYHKKHGHNTVKKIGRTLKKISCAHCSYKSASIICIQKHQEKHKIYEFSCCNCGLFLKSAQSLQAHNMVMKQCPHCDKKFCGKGQNLSKHMKVHHLHDLTDLKDEHELSN